jgi:hypothetical protein
MSRREREQNIGHRLAQRTQNFIRVLLNRVGYFLVALTA